MLKLNETPINYKGDNLYFYGTNYGYLRNVDNYTPIRDILKCSEIKKGEKR